MVEIINAVLWAVATSLIILSGLYFSSKLNYPQFKFNKIFKALFKSNHQGVTPIKTLFLTLAGRIGVGSIVIADIECPCKDGILIPFDRYIRFSSATGDRDSVDYSLRLA